MGISRKNALGRRDSKYKKPCGRCMLGICTGYRRPVGPPVQRWGSVVHHVELSKPW